MIVLSGDDVLGALLRVGFERKGQKGSHVKVRHEDGRVVIIPMHRELKRGTLKSILSQAGLTEDQLRELL
jgi:predicted RNA binding protein YcfA (HicA-like mRNA interferase family)